MLSKKIREDFYWVGNLDPGLRVFDIIMRTEFGTTYNSFILKGRDKNVLFEASKAKCFDDYIAKIESVMPLSDIDYLVLDHTEPDHTGVIEQMLEIKPDLKIYASTAALNFMKEIANRDFDGQVVKDGDTLDIGGKTLRFITAPNLHWPDTIFTYVPEIKTLVTCDCFGCHYSDPHITNDNLTNYEDYMKAALYYFDNILGPFKGDVLAALKKIEDLEIEVIATGHGPVLTENALAIVEFYRQWSTPRNPNAGKTVVIPYVSAYGYTKMMADKIEEGIRAAGDIEVRQYDMVSTDRAEVMKEIGFADGFLLGTPTMVGETLPPIWDITTEMNPRVHGGKFASAFGSYGWSGEGVPHIMARLNQLKLNVYGEGLRCRFKPDEKQLAAAYAFGYGFGVSVRDGKLADIAEE